MCLGSKESQSSPGASFRPCPYFPIPRTWCGALSRPVLLGNGLSWLLPDRTNGQRTSEIREADPERPLPSPQDPGARRDGEGNSEPNSPKGVSGGEVSRDGQVTPHLLPTPDKRAQLQTRLECLRLAADRHHDRAGAPGTSGCGPAAGAHLSLLSSRRGRRTLGHLSPRRLPQGLILPSSRKLGGPSGLRENHLSRGGYTHGRI